MLTPLLQHNIIRYIIIGGIGFGIDYGLMEALLYSGTSIHIARWVSMALAIGATYTLHRHFTFAHQSRGQPVIQQLPAFIGVQAFSALINYSVFYLMLHLFGLETHPIGRLLAVACGTGAGLILNFTLLRAFVFTPTNKQTCSTPFSILPWLSSVTLLIIPAVIRHQHILSNAAIHKPLSPNNADSWLRLVKIRDWINSGDFFHRTISGTNAPLTPLETPWTHFSDFLHLAVMQVLPTTLDLAQQLLLAGTWVPVILGIIAISCLLRAVKQATPLYGAQWSVVVLAGLNLARQNYLSPGNSDHHGLLMTLWCVILMLLIRPLNHTRAALTGITLGLMLWVSPEALIPAFLVFAGIGIHALYTQTSLRFLCNILFATTLTSITALLLETPIDQIVINPVYDMISLPYIALLAIALISCLILNIAYTRTTCIKSRSLATGLIGVIAGLSLWAFFPQIFKGPMVGVSTETLAFLNNFIIETKPLYKTDLLRIFYCLWPPVLAAFCWQMSRPKKEPLFMLAGYGIVLFFCLFVQIRWTYYLQPIAVLIIAITLPALCNEAKERGFRHLLCLPEKLRLSASLVLLIVFITYSKTALTYHHTADTCSRNAYTMIQSGALTKTLGTKNHVLFTHSDFTPQTLFFTPYRTIFGNYHRERQGYQDYQEIINQQSPQTAYPLIKERQISALLVCPSLFDQKSWLYKLSNQTPPQWLTPQTTGNIEPFVFIVK